MKIEIREVTEKEKDILRNLLHLCMHDYSEYDKFEIGSDGEFAYRWFDSYFQEEGRYAYLLQFGANLGGFVLVRSNLGNEDWDFQIAEFFILRRYRRMGLGKAVSRKILGSRRGLWEISFNTRNKAASTLWNSVAKLFSDLQIEEDYWEEGRSRFLIQTNKT